MYQNYQISTSSLYQNYPYQQNQMSDMNTPVPPRFAPIQPEFGEPLYENFYGQPQSAMTMHPALQQHQMKSYPVHQTPSQGFGFQQGQVHQTDNAQFHHPGFSYQYSVQQQQQVRPNYSVTQQAQPRQVERNIQEDVLVVEMERPLFPMSKARLRWTPELHGRFNRAALELGGYFKATPKAILQKMNVRGLSRDQLKSHLQKVRNRVVRASSVEEARSVETPNNHHENHRTAPINEDPTNTFKFKFDDFVGSTMSQTPTYHQNLRSAMCDHAAAASIKFKDADFY